MKKIIPLLVFILVAAAALTGCGSGNDNASKDNGSSSKDNGSLLKQVKSEGKLLIGTEGTYPPFTFHDDSGDLTGFDVEIAREVAKRLGVKPVFKETEWDAMFAGLNSKRFDMIANEVGIRPDREKKYDFSNPYIKSSAVVVTKKSDDSIKKFSDLKGKKTAQSLTSNYADIARKNGAQVVSVEGFNQAMNLIATGRVDATVNDKLSVLTYLKKQPDAPVKIAATKSDAAASAFMFRKNNDDLVKAVNKALADMKEDGTYLKISKKWFGTDVSK